MNKFTAFKTAFPACFTNKMALAAGINACACLLLTSPLALADDGALMPETGTLDTSPTVPAPPAAPTAPQTTVLQGGVHKKQHPELDMGVDTNKPLQSGASDQDIQLQPAQANRDDDPTFQLAAQKLASGQKLSAEEYRSLQAGTFGYETDRTFFTNTAKVSIVYKDSPADKAGIRKGDKILVHENDDEARKDPTQPSQEVSCGLAGTSETIQLLVHGKPTPITLTRMNIEDIEEPHIRKEWEDLVRQLGYPRQGTFKGPNLNSLRRVEQ